MSPILPAAPRLFRRERGVALARLAGAVAITTSFSGCAPAPAPPLVTRADLEAAAGQKSAKSGQNSSQNDADGSLNAALSKIDAPTVQAWLNRWNETATGAAATRANAVRIDTEVLARRHPAWQLADALERGAVSPGSPQIAPLLVNLAAPQLLARPSVFNSSSVLNSSSILAPPAALGGALQVRPATTLRARASNQVAPGRQNRALERFFASAAARDALRARDETFLGRRALENSIAAARRGAVAELDLALISPDVALELTNLRLQLLANLAKTPTQRAAARREIAVIEARYAQIWREQTALQAEKMRRVTVENPARAEREGLVTLSREAQQAAQRRATARRDQETALEARWSEESSRSGADLALRLPSVPIVPAVPSGQPGSGSLAGGPQFFETRQTRTPSQKPLEAVSAAPRRFDAALVAGLRRQARDDARGWAALVAAGWNRKWSQKVGAPDRTQAAVEQLFSRPSSLPATRPASGAARS